MSRGGTAHTADVYSSLSKNVYRGKREGGINAVWCRATVLHIWHPRSSELHSAHSPRTRVRFCSFPDTTESWTVAGTPWGNCCGSRELSAGWNYEVSRCHSSFMGGKKKRRLGVSDVQINKIFKKEEEEKEMSPQWVCSGSSIWVVEQAALSPAHCAGLSPGPFPVCRLADCGGSLPPQTNGAAARWQRLQILRSLAAGPENGATATPIQPPACVRRIHPIAAQNVHAHNRA